MNPTGSTDAVRLGSMKTRQGFRDRFQLLVLGFVTVAVGLPMLFGRVLSGQDIVIYLINAQQLAANLRTGAIFPAWAGGFNAGFGAPTFLFFPPLTSFANAVPALLGIPVIAGVCGLAFLAHLASGLAMFWWVRSLGFQSAALPASVVYMVAPYRLFDIYRRTALAEHWAFIWPPLILWVAGSRRLRTREQVPLLALLVAALLLTHLPSAILMGIGLVAWFCLSSEIRSRRFGILAGATLGFLLAGFALIPQALAPFFLDTDRFFSPVAGRFRPSANTLFASGFRAWDFNLEVSVVLLATFALVVVAFWLLAPETKAKFGTRAILVGAIFCALAATPLAGPVWEALPVLSRLQFPWRVAGQLTLIAAVVTAQLDHRRAWLLALGAVVFALPFSGWDWTLPRAAFASHEPGPSAPGSVFPDPHAAWEASSGGWYWRHENLTEIWYLAKNMKPALLSDLAGERRHEFDPIRGRPAVLLEDPTATIRVISWGPVRREIQVTTKVGGTLLWRAISFPEMRADVDGREVATFTDPSTGLVAHRVPKGQHSVEWSWHPFRALRWARGVSLLAFLMTIALGLTAAAEMWSHRGRHELR